MELSDIIRGRRMTRAFSDEPVDREIVERIFASALLAPSAGFAQGPEFLVLLSRERRERFWSLVAEQGWADASPTAAGLIPAPVIALALVDPTAYDHRYRAADKSRSALADREVGEWSVPYPTVDAAFAAMLVLLAAEDEGLGALFFHLQGREHDVLSGLDVPDGAETIGAIAIGHRSGTVRRSSPTRVRRRTDAERIHLDHFPKEQEPR